MFGITVESTFSATHQLRLPGGAIEPLHGHDWVVRVHCTRSALDDYGMVIDFEHARSVLDEVIAPLRYANLSELAAFQSRNATAESVALLIYDGLIAGGIASVCRVEVTEAPGCTAYFENPLR